MRKKPQIPRILKIEKVDGLQIVCMFNNGELRLINLESLFDKWNLSETDIEYPLLQTSELKKVELRNHTLSWKNIRVDLVDEDGNTVKHPYEIDPVVLFNHSSVYDSDDVFKFGKLLRKARQKAGLTQQQLAAKSGTSRFYISRVENDKTDIALSTFRKIVEAGLDKHLKLIIE